MKRLFILACALNVVINKSDELIKELNENLDALNVNGSDEVNIDLTISKAHYTFVKVRGKWGIMTCKGSWEPFSIVPLNDLEIIAERVQRVVAEK